MSTNKNRKNRDKKLKESIRNLIGNKDEINLEWLKTVTQASGAEISKLIIQEFGLVVLDGMIYSKEKAEKKLKQMQESAQTVVDRETFRTGPVNIDMMKLREKLWTARFPEKVLGQNRHQFCPIWAFLEGQNSSIVLRYDWISRLDKAAEEGLYTNLKTYELNELINEIGEDFKGKARVIFAKTHPKNTTLFKNKPIWVLFLVAEAEGGIRLEGLDMINILSLSTKFKSREVAFKCLSEYIEFINFIVNDPTIFEEVIIAK